MDREKVIKGLEMCLADEYCDGCPYEEDCFDPDIDNPWGSGVMRDALAMLKEQDAVEPTWQQGKAYCGVCGKRIPLKIKSKFCHKCGKPILWKDRWMGRSVKLDA